MARVEARLAFRTRDTVSADIDIFGTLASNGKQKTGGVTLEVTRRDRLVQWQAGGRNPTVAYVTVTRDDTIRMITAMMREASITSEELEGEQVIQALAGGSRGVQS